VAKAVVAKAVAVATTTRKSVALTDRRSKIITKEDIRNVMMESQCV